MNEAQEVTDQAKRTILSATAAIAETKVLLTATDVMYATLGMSSDEFIRQCSGYLSEASLKQVEESVRSTEAWVDEVCTAVANPAAHPLKHLDVKSLRLGAVKRKFV